VSKRSRTTRSAAPPSSPASAQNPASAKPAAPAPGGSGGVASTSGRRVRTSAPAPRPPLQRYRGTILGAAIVAAIAIGGVFLFLGASQPAYACATVLQPEPSATPGADATPRLGQVTRDLGRAHVQTGDRVRYEFCPPTSGPHYNDSRFGPIATRFYGSDARTDPQGWIHNLEHGQMSVLYRCPEGCDEAAQAALRALQDELPPSPLCSFPADTSVVVTRFDDLPTPYAAVVWGRVLFLETLDPAAIAAFSAQSADRGPEPQCQAAVPGASPSAAPTAAP